MTLRWSMIVVAFRRVRVETEFSHPCGTRFSLEMTFTLEYRHLWVRTNAIPIGFAWRRQQKWNSYVEFFGVAKQRAFNEWHCNYACEHCKHQRTEIDSVKSKRDKHWVLLFWCTHSLARSIELPHTGTPIPSDLIFVWIDICLSSYYCFFFFFITFESNIKYINGQGICSFPVHTGHCMRPSNDNFCFNGRGRIYVQTHTHTQTENGLVRKCIAIFNVIFASAQTAFCLNFSMNTNYLHCDYWISRKSNVYWFWLNIMAKTVSDGGKNST